MTDTPSSELPVPVRRVLHVTAEVFDSEPGNETLWSKEERFILLSSEAPPAEVVRRALDSAAWVVE